jgi:hypothetical protein
MKFQEKIFHKTTYLRPKYPLPPYPSYHKGLYLEEYFCNFFIENYINKELVRYYLPIFWTNIYQKNWIHAYKNPAIQCYLNTIPKEEKYFTVCQHDDAPHENIEDLNIHVYSAGGNYPKGIPIPLICSKMPEDIGNINVKKDIFCSFVGSNTHDVRKKLVDYCSNKKEYIISCKDVWQYNVNKSEFDNFIDITQRSKFTLCPRGYGKQSYRFCETIQLGSIPIYVYDNEPYLPFSENINYDDFSIVLNIDDINQLDDILKSKSDSDISSMMERGKEIYNEYFTLDKVCENIISSLVE